MALNLSEVEILLVEDSLDDAEMTLRALQKANVANHIHHVVNGAEALDFVFCKGDYINRTAHHQPKLILLDLKLPKVDGLEVLQRLKDDSRTKTIPVVVLTSSKEQKDIVESYRLGVNSYIVKPVNFEGFAQTVRDLGLYWILLNQAPRS